ncbi:MAG TPA: Rmf/CrpP family protein [Aurantimonas sp.]|jgi:ribosome modulation factor|nr:Rmf/CrpP family protein [Aurantimonas sp.]
MSTDAYEQGKLAFQHNHPMSSCEYPAGSTFRAAWMEGWTEARNAAPGEGGERPGMMSDAKRATRVGQSDVHES